MIQSVFSFLVFATASLLLGSCSSSRKSLDDFEKEIRGGSYVFLGYKFAGKDMPKRCLMVLETPTKAGVKTIDFEIYDNARYLFARLDPGTYKVFRIKCGYEHYRVGNFFGVSGGRFVIRPGKINFVGDSRMVFGVDKDMSFQWGQKMSLEFLATHFPRMHPSVQRRVVNAYTAAPISESMIVQTKIQRAFNARYSADLTGVAASVKDVTAGLKQVVQSCVELEEQQNPLKFGNLVYQLIFRQGRVVNLKSSGEHAYSRAFPICLEKKLRPFMVSSSKEFEFILHL